jgi:hypothetical protein
MQRLKTLIEKLQQQLEQQASPEDMLQTVNMLYTEIKGIQPAEKDSSDKVYVLTPPAQNIVLQQVAERENDSREELIDEKEAGENVEQKEEEAETSLEPTEEIEEKVIEVLQVNEKEIEEELNEIKKNAEAKNKMSAQARPVIEFDPIEDVPTLTHQTALKFEERTDTSLNAKLKEPKKEVSELLTDAPIKDLKKAIGINDRYLYINELFRGDEAMYERSIKTINNFSIFAEAEFWIRRELKLKIGWKDDDTTVKQFDQLIRRRFS